MSRFALETQVTRFSEHRWRAQLHEGWRIGAVPNGGYVLSVAGRALKEALPHRDPQSVSAFYLAPTEVGAVDCEVEVLRLGRGSSQACVKMVQAGELKTHVTATYTDLSALSGEDWSSVARPNVPAWEACKTRARERVEFYREAVEIRLASGLEVFDERGPDGSGEIQGWVRFRDGSDADAISLLLFADAVWPPIFTVFGPQRWIPTVELTVQVRAIPAPGPLQVRFRSCHLTGGVVEEDGELWDSTGELVAISRQMAKVRIA
ncbi:MAG: thioesterase family protein [Pseudomonadota bacterium]